ncbi:MAG TPA: HipA domain-containing protein [Aquiluna sp.]
MRSVSVQIELAGSWQELGQIRSETKRGSEFGAFGYSDSYLSSDQSYAIEPALPLANGYSNARGSLHGAFRDAAPDRWGRNLITRAIRQSRPQGTISELDFLLGVSDVSRVGNFRFDADQNPASEIEIPTLTTLPRVLRLSEEFEQSENFEITKALLGVGSASLGGARPKSSVLDQGTLMIAKFPHANDKWDVMAWEAWSLGLSKAFGLNVPEFRTIMIDGKTVLLLNRFDRVLDKRIGYVSAMTMLGKNDGDSADYLELVEAITTQGAQVKEQLLELFKSVLVSVAIRNTDDHLRNHGFLRTRGGWNLSPLFDVNPTPPSESLGRSTTISGAVGTQAELAALIEFSESFGLDKDRVKIIISELGELLRVFTQDAKLPTVPKAERELMNGIFNDSVIALART